MICISSLARCLFRFQLTRSTIFPTGGGLSAYSTCRTAAGLLMKDAVVLAACSGYRITTFTMLQMIAVGIK